MTLGLFRPRFSWHSELEKLTQDPSFQTRMGALPNSTPAPVLQTSQMTDQLLGYHLALSDDLRVRSSLLALVSRTWLLGEEKVQSYCRCYILSCQRFYKHLKASHNIMSVWSTRLQCSSQTPLETMASWFPQFPFYDQVEEVTCSFSNLYTASLVSVGLANLPSVALSPFLKLFILPFLCARH